MQLTVNTLRTVYFYQKLTAARLFYKGEFINDQENISV